MFLDIMYRFGIALGIALLIGLQRESSYRQEQQERKRNNKDDTPRRLGAFAGVRTFPFFAIAGFLGAYAADELAAAIIFAGTFGIVGLLITIAYYLTAKENGEIGMTTEMAAVVTVLLGALCYWDQLLVAIALGIIAMALLSLKPELHLIARRVTHEDITATLKFAIITAIILPLLPNETYGSAPFNVLNPYNIGLMVVFISGINFLGYILIQFIGTRHGIGLSGFLGGLVSSTAVTFTFSQRSKQNPLLAKSFALAILAAWIVMFVRVLIEVAVVNRALLDAVVLPIAVVTVVSLGMGLWLFVSAKEREQEDVNVSNPFELSPAIQFALFYGLILFVNKAAQMWFGETGLYVSSILSGLVDVDAITLSMAELSLPGGGLEMKTAARAIVLASMSNTFTKLMIVVIVSAQALRKVMITAGVTIVLTGILSMVFLI